MITLYKEYSIGIKKLSDAELDRETSPSGQTHIGLSERVFTFLPNTPTQIEGVLVFNKSCTLVECAFSKIGNKRSTKIDSQTTNPVKSVVKQIRNIASNPEVNWYLIWFAFENQMPVFWLIGSNSEDYSGLESILSGIESTNVIKAAKDEYFFILEQVRKIKKLFTLVESRANFKKENRLIATSPEHRTFVHLSLDYFRANGNLDNMIQFFNTKSQNTPITVQKEDSFKLQNMFIFADEDEIKKKNEKTRRWYIDPFIVEGRKLYLYVDWYPGKDDNGNDTQLMIPDFAKFVKDCFGSKYVYRNAQGTHELWEINNPEAFSVLPRGIVSESETPHLNVSNGKLIKESTNIVEFFAFAVKTLLNYDPDFSKAQGEFKYNQVTVGFKYCPFGKKTEGLENITDPRRSNDCDTSITWNLDDTEYCFLKEQSSNSLKTFAGNINQIYSEKYRIDIDGNQYKMYELADDAVIVENQDDCDNMDTTPVNFIYSAQQTIYYGAPGTGKSHTIDGMVTDENSIRTTFHPDSDYSTFVGAYKPKMDGEKIVYKFQPQAFLKAYCKAWKNSEESIYLVIEEINRGNCAQIFGDLFQLLDRCNNGYSSYAIEPDSDITDFLMTDKEYSLKGLVLTEDITNDNGKVIASAESVKMGKKLVLPPNMSILCTMNTSDQSLFPMDSAFKRRWQWRYTPIEQPKAGEAGEPRKWKIKADGRWCYWWEFLQAINEVIEEVNHSEDKQLGYFFAKPDDGDYINAKTFVNKVVFYLWNDIFKDEECDIFKYNPIKLANEDEIKIDGTKEDTELTFRRFIKNSEEVREDVVRWFIDNILKEKEISMLDDVKQEPVADKVAYMREITELSSDSSLSDDKDTTVNSDLENKCKVEYKPLLEAIVRKLGKREYKFYDNGFDTNISDMPISYTRIATTMAKGQNGYAEVKLYNAAQSSNKYAKDLFDYLIGKDAKTTIENMANEQNVEFRIINEDAATKVTGWALKMSIDFNSLNVEEVSDKLYAIIDSLLKVSEPWIDEFRASHK